MLLENEVLHKLGHYLPSQLALKDFVHHNTLHAFERRPFHDALWQASQAFGYTTYLSLEEFRAMHGQGRVSDEALDRAILAGTPAAPGHDQAAQLAFWRERMFHYSPQKAISGRLGQVRKVFKDQLRINLGKLTHPILFRLLSAYFDQGVATWRLPLPPQGFLHTIRQLSTNGFANIFKTNRCRNLLLNEQLTVFDLLEMLIGDSRLFENYLFDQQFEHPGWSGFVHTVSCQPATLLEHRPINLKELVVFELLLELDVVLHRWKEGYKPIGYLVDYPVIPIDAPCPADDDLPVVLRLWQESYEWTYFNEVLKGLMAPIAITPKPKPSFQALFCIDDREYSLRRHLERVDPTCDTYGTPGYFGIAFYYQPEHGKFFTKACPAPISPAHLVKEEGRRKGHRKDPHLSRRSHKLLWGWLIASFLGYWSLLKLLVNLAKPSLTRTTNYSFAHMDQKARLLLESTGQVEHGLQVGFTPAEMAQRVEAVLRSIGLARNFAPLVYVVGHGATSTNNPYFAGYDCGACSGRPGAVNARVFADMANRPDVRQLLAKNGLTIPPSTVFMGAMHDTTRDQVSFYPDAPLSANNQAIHEKHREYFEKALKMNAKERSYRFATVRRSLTTDQAHHTMALRAYSLFEPRPEWNHTDNALCIIGRDQVYRHLFLDKRPFINSYDYREDPTGASLIGILSAAIPVCAGINLEYYFSRVDQQMLGAGTKLPHNIVGLFAVNNGIDGDLRPGLPSQMVEIHDPYRILFVIEHLPEVVQKVFDSQPALYHWVQHEWVLLCVLHPMDGQCYRYCHGEFAPYVPFGPPVSTVQNEGDILEVIDKQKALAVRGQLTNELL
ncbi:MAG: DUF2309 domain-containing protein [Bacteroidetes bacterium]|nr:DUF2309 domain-containing protein [Bacteroidota bacterium]